jgi:EF hand
MSITTFNSCLCAVAMVLVACHKPPAATPAIDKVAGNPDMSQLSAAVDSDGDGKMSEAEWSAQGLPASSFNGMAKGRGYVTQHDYEVNAAPPGIDGDNDGVVTVEEFREFDRKMSAQMAKDGKAPPLPPVN